MKASGSENSPIVSVSANQVLSSDHHKFVVADPVLLLYQFGNEIYLTFCLFPSFTTITTSKIITIKNGSVAHTSTKTGMMIGGRVGLEVAMIRLVCFFLFSKSVVHSGALQGTTLMLCSEGRLVQ